jgi:CheY-like chemotaxis protein
MAGERVLVVEDNPLNLELVKALLEKLGYTVLVAGTAEEGIECAKAKQPHLILMDVNLPGTDGLTATAILKAEPATKHIPVVALTAHAMKGDDERVLSAGCDGYMPKPIDTRTFPGLVAGFLRQARVV